jgi:hypothetical protein
VSNVVCRKVEQLAVATVISGNITTYLHHISHVVMTVLLNHNSLRFDHPLTNRAVIVTESRD